MEATDPQFLYMVLILPSLFGLTLIGEGLNRIMKSELAGWVSIFFGVLFMVVVVITYFFVSGRLAI